MHAERDHLVRFVFPELREELRMRRIHLHDVDLRWGVTSEQDALEVCREIIDECRPRFLCILGGRYGWTPEGQDRSITADEVYYAALNDADRTGYHLFYFREPAATASMVEENSGEYRELSGSENERKLQELKQSVIDGGFKPFLYPAEWSDAQQQLVNLKQFGARVYAELLASIDDEFGEEEPQQLNEFAEEQAQTEAFMEERSMRFIAGARQSVLDELTQFARSAGEPNLLVLTGTPGTGKSALLAKFCRDWATSREIEKKDSADSGFILPHFVGASIGSTDLRRTLRWLCHQLREVLHEAEPAAELDDLGQGVLELSRQFPALLEQAAGIKRIVLLIDAVNQMEATDNTHGMHWLPRQLPENVRVIVSSLEHAALDALRKRGGRMREIELAPLAAADARAIIEGVLGRYRKRMSDEQISLLLDKDEAARRSICSSPWMNCVHWATTMQSPRGFENCRERAVICSFGFSATSRPTETLSSPAAKTGPSACGTSPRGNSCGHSQDTRVGSAPWRSRLMATRPSPAVTTTPSACGTSPRGSSCGHSQDTRVRSTPWRSRLMATRPSPAAMTTPFACGTSPRGSWSQCIHLEAIGSLVAVALDNRIVAGTRSGQLHFLTPQNWPPA